MEFSEPKTELFWFISLSEGTEVVVNSIEDDFWEAKYEQTAALNDKVEIWDWLCL